MTNEDHKTNFAIDREKCEITAVRLFDAPRQMVWAAMTDPTLIPLWWGPKAYATFVEQFDLHPGGTWRFIQRDAAGKEFAFHGVTQEVVPFERIVQTFNFEGMPPGHALVQTMVFEDQDGKTRLTQTAKYLNLQDLDGMVQAGMESGLRESFGRLAELARAKKELTITRVFDAPRQMVWAAWTDPAIFAKWWGPSLFTTPVVELDVRPGGAIYIVMQDPAGGKYPMRGFFKEVKAPERIVFSSFVSFSGDDAAPDIENLNTVIFEKMDGKTRLTLQVQVVKSTPAAEGPLSGQEMGWRQSIGKLARLL